MKTPENTPKNDDSACLNSVFFALALESGLGAALNHALNPIYPIRTTIYAVPQRAARPPRLTLPFAFLVASQTAYNDVIRAKDDGLPEANLQGARAHPDAHRADQALLTRQHVAHDGRDARGLARRPERRRLHPCLNDIDWVGEHDARDARRAAGDRRERGRGHPKGCSNMRKRAPLARACQSRTTALRDTF